MLRFPFSSLHKLAGQDSTRKVHLALPLLNYSMSRQLWDILHFVDILHVVFSSVWIICPSFCFHSPFPQVCTVQAGLKLTSPQRILLPPPPKCWGHRHVPGLLRHQQWFANRPSFFLSLVLQTLSSPQGASCLQWFPVCTC